MAIPSWSLVLLFNIHLGSSSSSPDIAERGMVVTIFYDPTNTEGSTLNVLNRLQNGEFGPFYS